MQGLFVWGRITAIVEAGAVKLDVYELVPDKLHPSLDMPMLVRHRTFDTIEIAGKVRMFMCGIY
jgi:hypothetical protein